MCGFRTEHILMTGHGRNQGIGACGRSYVKVLIGFRIGNRHNFAYQGGVADQESGNPKRWRPLRYATYRLEPCYI
jgi:hypothetical protein